jgi:hypothetical protein
MTNGANEQTAIIRFIYERRKSMNYQRPKSYSPGADVL